MQFETCYLLLCVLPFLCVTKLCSLSNHFAHSTQYHCPSPGRSSATFVLLCCCKCLGERRSAEIWSRSLNTSILVFKVYEVQCRGRGWEMEWSVYKMEIPRPSPGLGPRRLLWNTHDDGGIQFFRISARLSSDRFRFGLFYLGKARKCD